MTAQVEMTQLKLIRSVFACNIHFRATEDERLIIPVNMRHGGEFLEEYSRAHFLQRFQIEDRTDLPFCLDVEFGALFVIEPAIMPIEREHYLRKVFPRLVFPYMREYVAEITRRGGFSPLMLGHGLFENFDEPEISTIIQPEASKWIH